MHGERLPDRRGQEQREGSPRLQVHCAAAVDADDAVVLPEAAAPQAAAGVDMPDTQAKARGNVGGGYAYVGVPLLRAEVDGA